MSVGGNGKVKIKVDIGFIGYGITSVSYTHLDVYKRQMLVGPVFLGMSAVFGSILVSHRNFIVFSLAPVFYNVGILFGALVLSRFFGPSGLAMGVVAGTLLHAAIQYPSVRKSGFFLSVSGALSARKDILRVIRLMRCV